MLDSFINGDLNTEWESRLREMVIQGKEDNSPIQDAEFRYYNNQLQRILVGDEYSIDNQKDQIQAMDKLFQFQQEYMDFLKFQQDGKERERPPTQKEKTDFLQERSRFWQWKGVDDATRHRLFRSGEAPPKGIEFEENLPGLGDDIFLLHPDLYDPSRNAVFESLQDLGDAAIEYNEALSTSSEAARKTFFGRLVIDTGMTPEELMKAQERILKK